MLKQLLTGGFALSLVVAGSIFTPVWAQSTTSPSRRSPQPSAGHMATPQSGTPAQTPAPHTQISQGDLQKFALVLQQIHTIQQEGRSQVLQVLQQHNLTEEQFNAIAQSRQQQPNAAHQTQTQSQSSGAAQAAPVTPDQLQQYEQAIAQLAQMHEANRTRMQQALAGQGLTIDQFNTILAAVRRDPQIEQQLLTLLHQQ